METIEITAPSKSHLLSVVQSLTLTGWVPFRIPEEGRLARNGQLLILRAAKYDARLRLFVYKVTGSSRGKSYERRIEITSTYQKGLQHLSDYQDVVLGFDAEHGIFVGVDPQRITHGGPTGNASSFFDQEGLYWDRQEEILIRPRAAKLFPNGLEFHAFFKSPCLAEYLLNVEAIHTGSYTGYGPFSDGRGKQRSSPAPLTAPLGSAEGSVLILIGPQSGSVRRRIDDRIVDAYEQGDTVRLRRARLSPEKLLDIKRRCEENGYVGEEFVLNYERHRLQHAGKETLATNVRWVSQESVCEGFDILSFEIDGQERFIEVKSTAGRGSVFEMTENEWQTAKTAGSQYHLYRVTEVRTNPQLKIFSNPCELEAKGLIKRSPSGWRVTLP